METPERTKNSEQELAERRRMERLITQIDCTAYVHGIYLTTFKNHAPCSFSFSPSFAAALQPTDVLDTPTMRAIHETIRPFAKEGWYIYLKEYLTELDRYRAMSSEDIRRLDEALATVRKSYHLPPRDESVHVTAGLYAAHFWSMDWKNEYYVTHYIEVTDSYYPTPIPGSIADGAFRCANRRREERYRDRAVYFEMLDDGLPETDDGTHPTNEELDEMLAYLQERCAPKTGLDGDGI